jgi:hypothetical protein
MPEQAKPYSGPFRTPPASLLKGAFGWNFESTPDGPGRWRPKAWRVFYPDHMLTVDYATEIAMRVTSIHSAKEPA